MGALISRAQRQDVLAQAAKIGAEAERVSSAIPARSRSTARTRRRGPSCRRCSTIAPSPTGRRASMTPKPSDRWRPSWAIPASTTPRIWPIAAAAASWCRSSPPTRGRKRRHDGKRRLSRARLHQQRGLHGRKHRPRLPPAAHGPWRAGARGRRRGTGRCARGPALHATHRPAGQPRHAERHHRPVAEGRARPRSGDASLHPQLRRPCHRRHAHHRCRARSRSTISSISRPSPGTRSTPTWTRPRRSGTRSSPAAWPMAT
jgi:hypothetical protein